MRRRHDRRFAAGEASRPAGEAVQPVGIEHERQGGSLEKLLQGLHGSGSRPEAGSDDRRVELGEPLDELFSRLRRQRAVVFGEPLRHRLGKRADHDGFEGRGTENRDEAGSRPQRAARREDGRSGLPARPGDDRDPAEGSLVGAGIPRRQNGPREIRSREEEPVSPSNEKPFGDSDVVHDEASAESPGRRQRMAELGRGKRDGHGGADRLARDVASIRGKTGGNVRGDDRPGGAIDGRDRPRRVCRERTVEARSEEGVHHAVRIR